MRLGLLVILVGVIYLLKNMGFLTVEAFAVAWPAILVFVGVSMVTRSHCRYHGFGCEKNICRGPKTCFCNCEGCKVCDTKE